MKLFKKLMAGVMAIAMLSVYTVALANETTISGGSADSTVSGSATGKGGYAGASAPVFTMTLPTQAAANASLAFMVDPQEIVHNSPPTGAGADSQYGTVIFTTTSGGTTSYNITSAPLKVTSMSSVDVTVNMLATLSDTKMKLSTTSGFATANGGVDDSKNHLYLAVIVSTVSGGQTVPETKNVTALGAKKDTVLKAVPSNFTTTISGGTVISTVSGTPAADTWNSVEYTVTGTANAAADWQIDGIDAPDLTIKWVVDPATKITTALADPAATADYTAALDKAAYATDELVTVFVKPTDAAKKLKTVTFIYSAINSKDSTVADAGKTVKAEVAAEPVNGAYKATFKMPAMAKSDATGYQAPSFTIAVG